MANQAKAPVVATVSVGLGVYWGILRNHKKSQEIFVRKKRVIKNPPKIKMIKVTDKDTKAVTEKAVEVKVRPTIVDAVNAHLLNVAIGNRLKVKMSPFNETETIVTAIRDISSAEKLEPMSEFYISVKIDVI